MGEVHLNFNGSSIGVNTKNCWAARGVSMTYLIQKAFKLLQKEEDTINQYFKNQQVK